MEDVQPITDAVVLPRDNTTNEDTDSNQNNVFIPPKTDPLAPQLNTSISLEELLNWKCHESCPFYNGKQFCWGALASQCQKCTHYSLTYK